MINSVVIVGGGFGGWYTAAAFKHNMPHVKVTVIDFNGKSSNEMLAEFHPQWT